MKQRLGIAVALVHDPELIILDEPTNGLDPQGIADMRKLITGLSRDFGKTVLVSSHLLAEIEIIANIARYHRKSHPKLKHEGFARLQSDEHRDLVRKLSAILRIAEGLDRGNIGIVQSVNCKIKRNSVEIRLKPKKNASRDLELEIWGAERKKMLFQEVYGREVRFVEI